MTLVRKAAGIALVALLVAICVGACTAKSTSAKFAGNVTRMTSATGQSELLLQGKASTTRGIVVFMHGIDSTQDELLVDTGLFPVRDALIADGYAIATSDAHGNNTGNPASLQDQYDLLADTRAKIPGVSSVDILAFSMGGLDALLTAASHQFSGLHAVALLSPACDLSKFLDGSFRGAISTAFNNPPASKLLEVVNRYNPIERSASEYAGYSYHFWQSPDDQVVPAAQSSAMIAHLASGGVTAPLTPLSGNHGNLAKLNPADVVAMFDRAGG